MARSVVAVACDGYARRVCTAGQISLSDFTWRTCFPKRFLRRCQASPSHGTQRPAVGYRPWDAASLRTASLWACLVSARPRVWRSAPGAPKDAGRPTVAIGSVASSQLARATGRQTRSLCQPGVRGDGSSLFTSLRTETTGTWPPLVDRRLRSAPVGPLRDAVGTGSMRVALCPAAS